MISERMGSFRRRCWMASFILKQLYTGIRPYFTGMRPLLVLALATVLLAQAPQTQQDQKVPDDLPTIKVDVDVVNILASVRDKRNSLVPNLDRKEIGRAHV